MMKNLVKTIGMAVLLVAILSSSASATIVLSDDFETDTVTQAPAIQAGDVGDSWTTVAGASVKADGGSSLDSILDLVSNTPGVGKTFSNIEARTKAIYNRVNADMFDVKEGLRTKWLGMSQDKILASYRNIITYFHEVWVHIIYSDHRTNMAVFSYCDTPSSLEIRSEAAERCDSGNNLQEMIEQSVC